MRKTHRLLVLIATITCLSLLFSLSAPLALAYADDLFIDNTGAVLLVIPSVAISDVLAESSDKGKKTETAKASAPTVSIPPSAKVVPLAPAHTNSTVRVNPTPTKDQKINVTVTTPTPQPSTAGGAQGNKAAPVRPAGGPTTAQPPGNVTTQVVNQVVAQGSKGEVILSIKPNPTQPTVTVQQGPTQVSTSLPVQIDTVTHAMSVVTPKNVVKISVLPTQAVQGVTNTGLVNSGTVTNVKLDQGNGQVFYKIDGRKSGKLFGILPVSAPVQVNISAQTGKITGINQPPYLAIFGFFVR